MFKCLNCTLPKHIMKTAPGLQACCSTAMKKGRRGAACLSSSTWSTQRATSWSTSRSSSVCWVGFSPSSVACRTQMKAHMFFSRLVERRGQLLRIYPFVLHDDWCTMHHRHILCRATCTSYSTVDIYFYHSNYVYVQTFLTDLLAFTLKS